MTIMNIKRTICFVLICMLITAMTGCGGKKDEYTEPDGAESGEKTLSAEAQEIYQYVVPEEGDLCADIFILDYGHIYVKLFRDDAPYAVENFVNKANDDEYDGTLITQAVRDYYLQGGKPIEGSKIKEESIWGGGFSNEISERLFPTRGALCMANQGVDGTNAMQFFIVANSPETVQGLEGPIYDRYGMSLLEYLKNNYNTELNSEQLERFINYGGAPWIYGHNTVFGQVYKGFDVLDEVIRAAAVGSKEIYIKKITVYEHV